MWRFFEISTVPIEPEIIYLTDNRADSVKLERPLYLRDVLHVQRVALKRTWKVLTQFTRSRLIQ
jgi:hypothetical protein